MKKSHSKLSKNEPVCIYKECLVCRIREGGGSLHEVGENCLKPLLEQKRGEWKQKLKKRGGAGLKGGCLKKLGD